MRPVVNSNPSQKQSFSKTLVKPEEFENAGIGLRLKGHSQLAHMRTRYHFITNLHITETQSILFLSKYDKDSIYRMSKNTLKDMFFSKRLRIKQKHTKDGRGIQDVL